MLSADSLFFVDSLRENDFDVFSAETTGPMKAKFHMEPQWVGGAGGGRSPHLGRMSRMAVKPNGKKSLKSFSGMKGPMSLGQGVQHWGHRSNKF